MVNHQNKLLLYFERGSKRGPNSVICKVGRHIILTFDIVKEVTNIQNTVGPANYCFLYITVFIKILCSAIYCVKHNIEATLVFSIHQFDQLPLSIYCCRIMLRSAQPFILSLTCVQFFQLISFE